jgi:hypothetical protein
MAELLSKLVISAEDRTQAAFDAIEARVKSLASTIASVDRSIGGTSRAVGSVGRNAALARRGTDAASSRSLGALGGFAATATGLGGVYGAGLAARGSAEAIGARQHEGARMDIAGESPEEIADATAQTARLATKFPNVSQTDLLHMLRNARSIVGSYKEAADIAEPLVKLRTLAQLARPGEDVSEDFDKLIKGLEIKGVTQHPEQFREYMEGIAKGINVFGDTLRPYEYYEMFKYGRQASPGLSEKFILGTGPTLAQELGGEGFGAAVAQFNRLLVSGVGKKGSFEELARLGLIDKTDVANIPGTGEGQGLKAGRKVEGWQLAQSDPNEWVKQYLLPAFDRAGIKDKDEQLREIGVLFQSQRAGQLVDLLATQQPRIEKDTALLKNAAGLSAADKALHEDPGLAWTGVKNSISGLIGAVGESIESAGVMTNVAQWISGITEDVTKETAAKAKGEGWLARAHLDAMAKGSLWTAGYRDDELGRELDREHARATASTGRSAGSSTGPSAYFPPSGEFVVPAHPAFTGASDWESKAKGLTLAPQAPQAQPQPPQGPQAVTVSGEAQVEHTVHVDVSLEPGLMAKINQVVNSLGFTVPLIGGGTGRMDSDAGPHRGGIGSM